ncbi:solute carrier family 26 protein [Oscillatoria sp. FACHB-1407]|uniref:solute carrier family 26 protein n=1 Tax=Oscillatoria sp. FACHB-1407 TaxID=2692847 RepID=UPI0016821480|nr:solute carrier family 26 protein [Oscillatoria sp. FACHB-1407]MBD2460614.1 solute carrier family 26 protein [Oscillatoria sp. FACHB-1407]
MAYESKHHIGWFSLPGVKRLRSYQRSWLRGDLLAGITVAAYLIPQCMAYGELAGVDPIVGLWAILPPMVLYTLLGSSPQLSVGPESTTAVMTAAAIAPLVTTSGSNYASLASLLAFMVGVLCIVGSMARLGFLANLLSKPILIGYMAGVAVIMIASQLGKVSGMAIASDTLFGEVWEWLTSLNQLHWMTAIVSVLVLLFLLTVQRRFPNAPGPLLAVLLATTAVALFHLDQQGVAVVGQIPAGLPHFALPTLAVQQVMPLVASALGIAIVGYSDNVLTARAFAARNHYTLDANQELLALGAANLGNGLMQGFPISSSGSRTVIGDALGSKTQVFSLVALVVILAVLLFLRPLLALFPKAALGAIVIYAATRLIEVGEFRRLWQFRRSEFALALVTTTGVLATDILVGVGVAVGLSVIDLFARITRPHDAVLGEVPDLPGLHDIEDWQGAKTIPGLVLYRYDAPLCFANAEDFKRRALAAIAAETTPVEWFVLSTEAIAEIDITAIDMLEEFRSELLSRGITFGMARVKQDLYAQLKRSHFLTGTSAEHIYFTLHTAIAAFHNRHSR